MPLGRSSALTPVNTDGDAAGYVALKVDRVGLASVPVGDAAIPPP
jgi:hypothetical protein